MDNDPVRVATVISGSGWEHRLVRQTRGMGSVQVVARCATAAEVALALPRVDAVVIGADVAWMTHHAVSFWHRAGASVIGIASNDPERTLLARAGCDAVFGTDVAPADLLGVATAALPRRGGTVVTVGGPRGAPGRTEVALGLAWAAAAHGPTLLVESDSEAPSLGLRLGLPPGSGSTPVGVGPIDVLTLPVRPGPLSQTMLDRVVLGATGRYSLVVVDSGPRFETGTRIMVVTPAPVVAVRAARMLATWDGDPPMLVANRVDHDDQVKGLRAATGLEPDAVVPTCAPTGPEPAEAALVALSQLARRLAGQGRAA